MPGRGNSRCKGPKEGETWPPSIKIVRTSVAGVEWAKIVQRGEVREGTRWSDHAGLLSASEEFGLYLLSMWGSCWS